VIWKGEIGILRIGFALHSTIRLWRRWDALLYSCCKWGQVTEARIVPKTPVRLAADAGRLFLGGVVAKEAFINATAKI
jgi:hypothetical protein